MRIIDETVVKEIEEIENYIKKYKRAEVNNDNNVEQLKEEMAFSMAGFLYKNGYIHKFFESVQIGN